MSTLHRVHLADCPATPWRNGGGTTRQLLAWPHGDDWRLRVSVAEIARSCDFSPFPGVRRWFAVLDGEGVALALPRGPATLTPHDEPVAFEGEDAPPCRLLGGTTHDLNFMARRGEGLARMRRARGGSSVQGDRSFRALFAAAPALVDIEDRTEALAAGTLLWSDDAGAAAWTLRTAPHAFWLTLEAE